MERSRSGPHGRPVVRRLVYGYSPRAATDAMRARRLGNRADNPVLSPLSLQRTAAVRDGFYTAASGPLGQRHRARPPP